MNKITIRNATANNLKNVDVDIPLNKLVAVVGKSGSGKSSLVYDVLHKASQGHIVEAKISKIPKTFAISQKAKSVDKMSLGETNLKRLNNILEEIKKGDLLIVDEPCAGMGAEDRKNILNTLQGAVKKGISVIVIEHSKDIIIGSDYVIEFGPGSGARGGQVIFRGMIEKFKKTKTPTSEYVFSNKASLADYEKNPENTKKVSKRRLEIKGITKNNLKNFNLSFPLGNLVCVIGRMGAGKSTILSVVYGALFKGKNAWKLRQGFKSIKGKNNVRRSYFVDQSLLSPISTSTPATYLGIWDSIRDVFAALPESKKLKLNKSAFGINIKLKKDIADKINRAKYSGKSMHDVLSMTIDEAAKLFSDIPLVTRKLGFLQEVGLGYLTLEQRSNTLSGGEAQRVRLAKILSKKLGDRCIYILDIPSRGLHLSNLPALIRVLRKIIDKNNTILISESREELINNCDFVVKI